LDDSVWLEDDLREPSIPTVRPDAPCIRNQHLETINQRASTGMGISTHLWNG